MSNETEKQRQYYAETAAKYDDMHMDGDGEHHIALGWLSSLIGLKNIQSVLDVGSGTGRVLRTLDTQSGVRVVGIEPVEALRKQGHATGIAPDHLVDGDALNLTFADNSFDLVCEFAVLHHIKDHRRAVSEMCRVAKRGVFISDSNNFGQGGFVKRSTKQTLHCLGLWPLYDRMATRGKGYHWSQGDGVYYSYSVFDDVPVLQKKFRKLHFLSTKSSGPNLYRSAPHVAIFATND